MFRYCPSCASPRIAFTEGKVFLCPDCDFNYFHNIAAANGCLIVVPGTGNESERLVFLVRGKEPGLGKLDLPGGFVDIGEGVLDGLCRELREEIGWNPPVPQGGTNSDVFRLFGSFSNVYEYRGIRYNTCDMYFSVLAPGLKPEDLELDRDENTEVRFLKPEEIDFSEFAFTSTVQAVKAYLNG